MNLCYNIIVEVVIMSFINVNPYMDRVHVCSELIIQVQCTQTGCSYHSRKSDASVQ